VAALNQEVDALLARYQTGRKIGPQEWMEFDLKIRDLQPRADDLKLQLSMEQLLRQPVGAGR